jgi:toxin ParE1/3/4
MTSFALSPRAANDLEEIWDYTAMRWSLDQAEVYIRQIKSAIEVISDQPRRGRSCDHIKPGYRRYFVGSHVLFYREGRGGVEIVRVLHQSMDFDRHL